MTDGAPIVVRVAASSANLGPGFDTLGMALTLHAEVGTGPVPDDAAPAGDRHPATLAARRLGGHAPLWVRSRIPMGRGLGFSGAVRIAGAVVATVERAGIDGRELTNGGAAEHLASVAEEVLHATAQLEGHADNVAASLYGGVVAAAGDRAVRVPLVLDPHVIVWIPDGTTSTEQSRRRLPPTVDRTDAVFNIGRVAMLVAALAGGDVAALRDATADRLHQDVRMADAPASRAALQAGLAAGAWCGWLSGSGPTIAFLGDEATADAVRTAMPGDGHVKVLHVDHQGPTLSAAPAGVSAG